MTNVSIPKQNNLLLSASAKSAKAAPAYGDGVNVTSVVSADDNFGAFHDDLFVLPSDTVP
jgi:hypothetical protein